MNTILYFNVQYMKPYGNNTLRNTFIEKVAFIDYFRCLVLKI